MREPDSAGSDEAARPDDLRVAQMAWGPARPEESPAGRGGFQELGHTAEGCLAEQAVREAIWSTLLRGAAAARRTVFWRILPGYLAVAQCVRQWGTDEFDRSYTAIFAHVLVMDDAEFAACGADPWSLVEGPGHVCARDSRELRLRYPELGATGLLPPARIAASRAGGAAPGPAGPQALQMLEMALRAGDDAVNAGLVLRGDAEDVARSLRWVLRMTPPARRPKLSFDTAAPSPAGPPGGLWAIGLAPDAPVPSDHGGLVCDLREPAVPDPVDRPPSTRRLRLLARAVAGGRPVGESEWQAAGRADTAARAGLGTPASADDFEAGEALAWDVRLADLVEVRARAMVGGAAASLAPDAEPRLRAAFLAEARRWMRQHPGAARAELRSGLSRQRWDQWREAIEGADAPDPEVLRTLYATAGPPPLEGPLDARQAVRVLLHTWSYAPGELREHLARHRGWLRARAPEMIADICARLQRAGLRYEEAATARAGGRGLAVRTTVRLRTVAGEPGAGPPLWRRLLRPGRRPARGPGTATRRTAERERLLAILMPLLEQTAGAPRPGIGRHSGRVDDPWPIGGLLLAALAAVLAAMAIPALFSGVAAAVFGPGAQVRSVAAFYVAGLLLALGLGAAEAHRRRRAQEGVPLRLQDVDAGLEIVRILRDGRRAPPGRGPDEGAP